MENAQTITIAIAIAIGSTKKYILKFHHYITDPMEKLKRFFIHPSRSSLNLSYVLNGVVLNVRRESVAYERATETNALKETLNDNGIPQLPIDFNGVEKRIKDEMKANTNTDELLALLDYVQDPSTQLTSILYNITQTSPESLTLFLMDFSKQICEKVQKDDELNKRFKGADALLAEIKLSVDKLPIHDFDTLDFTTIYSKLDKIATECMRQSNQKLLRHEYDKGCALAQVSSVTSRLTLILSKKINPFTTISSYNFSNQEKLIYFFKNPEKISEEQVTDLFNWGNLLADIFRNHNMSNAGADDQDRIIETYINDLKNVIDFRKINVEQILVKLLQIGSA